MTYRTVVLFLQWKRAIVLYWLADHLFSCLRRVFRKTSVSPETHTNGVKKNFCFERFCACTKYINFYLYTPCAGSYARKVIRTNGITGFPQNLKNLKYFPQKCYFLKNLKYPNILVKMDKTPENLLIYPLLYCCSNKVD